MANRIINKISGAPKITEFTTQDLVVDVQNGHLYYKTKKDLFKIQGDIVDTPFVETNITSASIHVGDITASNIAASDIITSPTIHTTNISSSGNISASHALFASMSLGRVDPLASSLAPEYTLDLRSPGSAIRINSDDEHTTIRIGAAGSGNDITLLRVGNGTGNYDSGQYGFSLKYMGGRSSDRNSLSLFPDFQNQTQRETLLIDQQGRIWTGEPTGSSGTPGGTVHIRSSGHQHGCCLFVDNTSTTDDSFGVKIHANSSDNGTIKALAIAKNNASANIVMTHNGHIDCVDIDETSDIKLKKDIKNLDINNILPKFKKLRPVHFTWKDENKPSIGFIAQEMYEQFPIATSGDLDWDPENWEKFPNKKKMGIGYTKIVPILTKVVQNQQKDIELLLKEVQQLKEKLNG